MTQLGFAWASQFQTSYPCSLPRLRWVWINNHNSIWCFLSFLLRYFQSLQLLPLGVDGMVDGRWWKGNRPSYTCTTLSFFVSHHLYLLSKTTRGSVAVFPPSTVQDHHITGIVSDSYSLVCHACKKKITCHNAFHCRINKPMCRRDRPTWWQYCTISV